MYCQMPPIALWIGVVDGSTRMKISLQPRTQVHTGGPNPRISTLACVVDCGHVHGGRHLRMVAHAPLVSLRIYFRVNRISDTCRPSVDGLRDIIPRYWLSTAENVWYQTITLTTPGYYPNDLDDWRLAKTHGTTPQPEQLGSGSDGWCTRAVPLSLNPRFKVVSG